MGASGSFCDGLGMCSGPENLPILQNNEAGQPIQAAGTLIHTGTKQSWHPRMPVQRSVDRHIRSRSMEGIPSFGKTRLGPWSTPQHPECGIVGAHATQCAWAKAPCGAASCGLRAVERIEDEAGVEDLRGRLVLTIAPFLSLVNHRVPAGPNPCP
jgi:hypothetical protein